MRLGYTAAIEAFRQELAAWLDTNRPDPRAVRAEPATDSGVLPAWGRRWIRAQFDAGWLRPSWPRAFGGREIDAEQEIVYFEEYARRGLQRSTNQQGLDVFAPSVYDFGTSDQRDRFLLPILRGEATAALGMSEPGAGSDLAGLSTTAVRDGDRYVVNGQKLWTSGATTADFVILFVRTDPTVSKHKGLSVLLVELQRTPGITIREISQATGPRHSDFTEVFFDDVVVPAANLLGEEGQGWAIANGSLTHERLMVWLAQATRNRARLDRLLAAARSARPAALTSALWRDRVAGHAIDALALECMGYRSVARVRRGVPAPEQSALKLFGTEVGQQMALTEVELLGCDGLVDSRDDDFHCPLDPRELVHAPVPSYYETFGDTIAAGTSQVQRDIIAERILGLPRRWAWGAAPRRH